MVRGAFFITRAKSNTDLRRPYRAPIDHKNGINCGQTVVFAWVKTAEDHPHKLRRIKLKDLESARLLVLFTNNFALSAATITELHRNRWKVELFFAPSPKRSGCARQVYQVRRTADLIKKFYGLVENAVKCWIWIAVSVYLLLAIVRKRLNFDTSLRSVLKIRLVMPFEKVPIQQAFQKE